MATVETVLPGVSFYSPFERPPDPQTLWTPIPRGLRGFTVHNGTLPAKPLDDEQTLHVTGTLPPNYAYVLSDFGFQIDVNKANDWEDTFSLNLQKFFQGKDILGSQTWVFPFVVSDLFSDTRSNGAASRDTLFSGPMWSPPGEAGIAWFMTSFNQIGTASAAGTVNAFITFWEFDREQIRKFPLNTPIPTISR